MSGPKPLSSLSSSSSSSSSSSTTSLTSTKPPVSKSIVLSSSSSSSSSSNSAPLAPIAPLAPLASAIDKAVVQTWKNLFRNEKDIYLQSRFTIQQKKLKPFFISNFVEDDFWQPLQVAPQPVPPPIMTGLQQLFRGVCESIVNMLQYYADAESQLRKYAGQSEAEGEGESKGERKGVSRVESTDTDRNKQLTLDRIKLVSPLLLNFGKTVEKLLELTETKTKKKPTTTKKRKRSEKDNDEGEGEAKGKDKGEVKGGQGGQGVQGGQGGEQPDGKNELSNSQIWRNFYNTWVLYNPTEDITITSDNIPTGKSFVPVPVPVLAKRKRNTEDKDKDNGEIAEPDEGGGEPVTKRPKIVPRAKRTGGSPLQSPKHRSRSKSRSIPRPKSRSMSRSRSRSLSRSKSRSRSRSKPRSRSISKSRSRSRSGSPPNVSRPHEIEGGDEDGDESDQDNPFDM